MGALKRVAALLALAAVTTVSAQERPQERQGSDQETFRFRSGVELINVTATVSDGRGRFVSGPASGGFPRLRGRRASSDHALHRGARAGQPRHRARHERQHGRRKDAGREAGAAALPLRAARRGRRGVSLPLRQPAGAGVAVDARQGTGRDGTAADSAARRDDAVRRDRGSHPAGVDRTQSQEGAAHHLRRQRLEQLHEDRRAEAADSRERSPRLCHRHRCDVAEPADTAAARVLAALQQRRPTPFPFPIPGGGGRRTPPMAPPRYPPPSSPQPDAGSGSTARHAAATKPSTSACSARSPTRAADARRSSGSRRISTARPPASPTS